MKKYDIIIIGGGIAGIGVALEATQQGYQVLLLEKKAALSGTSHNSLRIIHGGFRYLQNLDFQRMRQSVIAQADILAEYSQFVKTLNCVMPLKLFGLKSKYPLMLANLLYNSLRKRLGSRGISGNRLMTKAETEEGMALLKGSVPYGALCWSDLLIDDLYGLHEALKQKCLRQGVEILEHHEVRKIFREQSGFLLHAHSNQGEKTFLGITVVNACGPWIDQVGNLLQEARNRPKRSWCRAFNLVIKRSLSGQVAIASEAQSVEGSKRLYFVTPRESGSAIGTGYLKYTGSDSIEEREIVDFITGCNLAFPNADLTLQDVEKVETGVLPLEPTAGGILTPLGNEVVTDSAGYSEVLSTKYTTFMPQARKVLSLLRPYLASPS